MFKKIASDALGLSDIGVVVPKSDFDKTDADDFIFNELDEEIYFLIKTKADEYCFTNRAFIHVDGASAMSKKRLLKRYEYEFYTFENVFLETAGTIDLDVEIKFTLNNQEFSIDIHKKFINEIKDLYKALHAISVEQRHGVYNLKAAEESLQLAANAIGRTSSGAAATAADSFEQIAKFANSWLVEQKAQHRKKDFGEVFELFIQN